MAGIPIEQLLLVAAFLCIVWCAGRLFRSMKLPAILGELLAGIVLGPNFFDLVPFASSGECRRIYERRLGSDSGSGSMDDCLFISHTWLQWSHPDDAKGSKLALLKAVLRKAAAGTLEVSAQFMADLQYGAAVAVDAAALQRCKYVWFDLSSIPQHDAEAQGRDGMTYAVVEFANPAEPSRTVRVEALVDTGATDCEISQSLIDELGLTPFDQATFETAAGISMSSALYRAIVRVEGRESLVLLSPSEKDEEEDSDDSEDAEDAAARAADAALDAAHGFKAISDDGLLGHDALAALGLLVDCGRRKLVPAP